MPVDAWDLARTTDYDAAGNVRYDIQYDLDPSQQVVGWKVLDGKGQAFCLTLNYMVCK